MMENLSIPISIPESVIKSFADSVILRINEALDARLADLKATPVKLSRQEVCTLLKISLPTLSTYEKRGYIVGERIGRRRLYDVKQIEAFLRSSNR